MVDPVDDDEITCLSRNLMDLLQEAVAGTDRQPSGGGIIVEAVIILGWADALGGYGESFIRCGSPWGTEGLAARALRDIVDADEDLED